MGETRKLNVGGVTIVAKKLFNMEEYYKAKEKGVLTDYYTNLKKQNELGEKWDSSPFMWFVLGLIILGTFMAGSLTYEDIGSFTVIEVTATVVLAVVVIFTLGMLKEIYKEKREYKNVKKELDDVTTYIERLETTYPVLESLKKHVYRLYYDEFTHDQLSDVLNYLDSIPNKDGSSDVYLYEDPKDRNNDYETNMLLFSTEDENTFLRYDFRFTGDDEVYGEDSDYEVTTISIFQIKLDGSAMLTENFSEKLKYLEVMGK